MTREPAVDGPPPSFDEHLSDDWGIWVLQHGFPPFPLVLLRGEAVPVARYVGHDLASVMDLDWSWGNDNAAEDCVRTNFSTFYRSGDIWVPAGDRGGTGWDDPTFQPVLVDRCVIWDPHHGCGDVWTSLGMVTPDAAHVEVRQLGVIHTTPIVAPLNLITVTVRDDAPAIARVLDAQGRELLSKVLVAGS